MTTLAEINKQIAALEAQKQNLVEDERKAALKKVNDALAELNALGFNYSLFDAPPTGSKRRTGVRESVRKAVTNAPDGIKPGAVAEQLGMSDKGGKQSVANALSALKKAKLVSASNGVYRPV